MKDKIPTKEALLEDISFLIWQITKTWMRGKQRVLEEFDITASQMEILSAIYWMGKIENDKEITQISLSQHTQIDPMTTSTILRNLQKKELITRKASNIDTRARIVEITTKGEEKLLKAAEKLHSSTDEVLKKLDQDALRKQLQQLLAILTESNN